MKNYEEMAQSVLKRRDTEIKRRRRAFLIGAPCAAAVIAGAVGIGAAVPHIRGGYINPVVAGIGSGNASNSSNAPAFSTGQGSDNGGSDTAGDDAIGKNGNSDLPEYTIGTSNRVPDKPLPGDTPTVPPESNASAPVTTDDVPESTAEVATTIVGVDIAVEDPSVPDYTNPNAGQNDIRILDIDEFIFREIAVELDENDFDEYTLDGLDAFYGLRFNRLSELYPDWRLSFNRLGVYRHMESDGFMASLKIVSSLNTLTYTNADKTVTVSAQYGEFTPVSKERLSKYKPVSIPEPTVITEYDENGNIIGQSTPAYDPGSVKVYPDEGASVVNGYEALIYRSSDGDFLADLDMSSPVRITASGLSDEEFLEVLDNFTK